MRWSSSRGSAPSTPWSDDDLDRLPRSREAGPPGEPKPSPARTEPRPPGGAGGRLARGAEDLHDPWRAPVRGPRWLALALVTIIVLGVAMILGVLSTSRALGAELGPGPDDRTPARAEAKGPAFEVTC